MDKMNFRKIFVWITWLTLVVLVGDVGLFVLDLFHNETQDLGLLAVLIGLVFFSFAVDSLMKENPEREKRYFIQWLIVCGLLVFLGLTIYVWYG